MLGSAIVRELQRQDYNNIITFTHKELDLLRQDQVEVFFASEKPEYVFLAEAKVGGIIANLCVFLMNKYSGNETVNAGTGKKLTIKSLTEIVTKVVSYEGEIKWDTTRPNGIPRKLLLVSKAKLPGWEYRTDLVSGIRLAYDDFLHNPMRVDR